MLLQYEQNWVRSCFLGEKCWNIPLIKAFAFTRQSFRLFHPEVRHHFWRQECVCLCMRVWVCVCVWTASCCSPSWTPIGQWNEKKLSTDFTWLRTRARCCSARCQWVWLTASVFTLFFFSQRLRCTSSVSYRSSPILNILMTLMWVKYVVFKL